MGHFYENTEVNLKQRCKPGLFLSSVQETADPAKCATVDVQAPLSETSLNTEIITGSDKPR